MFVDRVVVEEFGEDGLDFGEGIEPGQQSVAEFAIGEASIELVAELLRKAGDFARHSQWIVDC